MKTDSQLQQDVMDELEWEPSVHAEQIGVAVKNGVVTLAGHVSSYLEKFNAEHAAQRVAGVRALAVEMDVKLAAVGHRTDGDIAQSAQSSLLWMASPVGDKVKVMVEKGWITLTGTVEWQFQKLAAGVAVRFLPGVVGVSNDIIITPAVQLQADKVDIEAALVRRAKADAKKISVQINGTALTLTGKVDSWAERDTAKDTAWGTPGVTSVIDKMTMDY